SCSLARKNGIPTARPRITSNTTNRTDRRWSANSLFATTAQPERGTDRARGAGAFVVVGAVVDVMPRLRGPARSGRRRGGRCPRATAGPTGSRSAGDHWRRGGGRPAHGRAADGAVAAAGAAAEEPWVVGSGATTHIGHTVDPPDGGLGLER